MTFRMLPYLLTLGGWSSAGVLNLRIAHWERWPERLRRVRNTVRRVRMSGPNAPPPPPRLRLGLRRARAEFGKAAVTARRHAWNDVAGLWRGSGAGLPHWVAAKPRARTCNPP